MFLTCSETVDVCVCKCECVYSGRVEKEVKVTLDQTIWTVLSARSEAPTLVLLCACFSVLSLFVGEETP